MRLEVTDIARVCHNVNRAYALANGEQDVYPEWEDAPMEIQKSAIMGVQYALQGETPEQLHESWCRTKLADGWIWGAKKDLERKWHPCLVPYDELDAEQKHKDAIFGAIVKALSTI